MNSTFMGLEIAKSGLMSHQQALHVTGHNISNAENADYSRQRVVINAKDPLYMPSMDRANTPGQLGQGAVVSEVERIRDSFVDDRIVTETNIKGYWDGRSNMLGQLEMIYNEPSDKSLRTKLDSLWQGWEELSKYPEERSTREVVKEKAIALTTETNQVYRQLDDLQKDANRQVASMVDKVNLYSRDIRELNERIMKSEAVGDNPNDLKDARDALIEKLSEMVNISVGRSDKDEVIVYLGTENLVQGEVVHELKLQEDPENNGFYKIVWDKSGSPVEIKSGKLFAMVEMRDKVIQDNINQINSFAVNLTDLTNEVHRDGFGRNNETNVDFFKVVSASNGPEGNVDLNNDGVAETTAIFKVAGSNKITDASAAIGISGVLTFAASDELDSPVNISYNESDTVNTMIKKINESNAGVVAYLDHRGNLAIKATIADDNVKKNFMIRHLEDSGQFLVGMSGILKQSGPAGSFDYTRINDIVKLNPDREHITLAPEYNPASYMAVSESIKNNVDRIAAARGQDVGGTGDFNKGNGIGDGSNALLMASLRHKKAMIESSSTFNDFYVSLVSKLGAQGEQAQGRVDNQETMLKNLENLRKSVSGVNLDEEMSNMIAFQHGYNAAARVINTMDKMLETILGLGIGR